MLVEYPLALAYQPLGPGREALRPLLRVRLVVGKVARDTRALVDSGSDFSIFHASLGQALGLALDQGRPLRLIGVGGYGMGYVHRIGLRILDASFRPTLIRSQAVFSEALPPEIGNLLGRRDFFRAYLVGFEGRRQRLYLG